MIFGAELSPWPQAGPRAYPLCCRHGRPSQPIDPVEDRGDESPRHRHLGQLDGRAYEVLTPAAERLAGKYPAAASLLYRRMVESILKRGSSKQYGYAARDVQNSASLAGRVADEGGIEGHEAFVARLKREHGRKYSFWQLLEEA